MTTPFRSRRTSPWRVPWIAAAPIIGLALLPSPVQAAPFDPSASLAIGISLVLALAAICAAIGLWLRARHARREIRRMRAIANSLPFDFWACDQDGRYVFQNAASLQHWGSHLGDTPDDVDLDPDTRALWHENNRRALEGELVIGKVSYTFNGERREHTNVIGPMMQGGQVAGLVGINVGIPDLRSALAGAEEFERHHALLNAIFRESPETIVATDAQRRIRIVNPAFKRLFGYSEAEIIGQNTRMLYVDPAEYEQVGRGYERRESGDGHEGRTYTVRFRARDGHEFHAETVTDILRDANGAQIGYVGLIRDVTERMRAEEEYRGIFNNVTEGLCRSTPDGRILRANPALVRLFGYSTESELIESVTDVAAQCYVHPEDRDELIERLNRDGRVQNFEVEMYRPATGERIWVTESAHAVHDDSGKLLYCDVSLEDITERKHAEEELARSERRYREFYERTPVMLHTIDRNGRLIAVSGFWLEHLGYRKEEVLGRRSVDFLTEESRRDALRYRLPEFFRSGRVKEVPFQVVKANGEVIDVLLSAVAEFDNEGKLARGLAVMSDVTEQRRAESQLREAAAVFANTADGVFITDPEGTIRDVNRAFTQITGFTSDDVIGRNPRIWKSDQHESDFYRGIWRSLERNGHWRGEIWNRRKDGELYPAWMTVSQVLAEDGGLSGYVAVFSDISNVKDAEARLDHLAHHDSLTDLPNRLLLNDRLEHALQRAKRYGTSLALVFIDLDRFKHVNDSLGHTLGDELLRQAGDRLSRCLRTDDTVARIGGDEFTLLLEDIGDKGCVAVAEKVLARFAEPFELARHEVYLSPSLGIALHPENGEDADTLLRNADAAMYQAKHHGGNTYAFYTTSLTERAYEKVQLEGSLRRALEREEFDLHYQPQVDMVDKRVVGVEALLRWEHPKIGPIGPDRFIPIAEETGMIVPLGSWVLRQACRDAAAWLASGIELERIAVNVGGPQIRRGDLVSEVRSALDATGLPPSCLELEVTEGFIMEQAERSLTVLNELRKLGVRLAIDDFGTGYSSLSYLKRLPVNVLKIDRSFVRDVPADTNNVGICRAVIALGANLDLEVVAEGVETDAQQEFLIAAGCTRAQGYRYAAAMPASELESWCMDWSQSTSVPRTAKPQSG